MTVLFLFGTISASCSVLSIDPFRQLAGCGDQLCRYRTITYETELAALQVDCLPEVIVADGFESPQVRR